MIPNTALETERNATEQLTPGELVKKHMEDPHHVITDEEFRNVKFDFDSEITLHDDVENKTSPKKREDNN